MHWPKYVLTTLVVGFVLYTSWVYTNATAMEPLQKFESESYKKGMVLWQKNNCFSCHQIFGLGGYLGPELTKVISQKGESYAKAFIKNGSNRMPRFGFNDDEVNDLITYLSGIDSVAVSYNTMPIQNFGNTILHEINKK